MGETHFALAASTRLEAKIANSMDRRMERMGHVVEKKERILRGMPVTTKHPVATAKGFHFSSAGTNGKE